MGVSPKESCTQTCSDPMVYFQVKTCFMPPGCCIFTCNHLLFAFTLKFGQVFPNSCAYSCFPMRAHAATSFVACGGQRIPGQFTMALAAIRPMPGDVLPSTHCISADHFPRDDDIMSELSSWVPLVALVSLTPALHVLPVASSKPLTGVFASVL